MRKLVGAAGIEPEHLALHSGASVVGIYHVFMTLTASSRAKSIVQKGHLIEIKEK